MLTPESRFEDFPQLRDFTYLNSAAEGIPPKLVRSALENYWEHKSLGMLGRDFHFPELEKCRETAARMLRRNPEEVSFCSCSSEAYNLLASALQLKPADEVVISDLDFPAGATPWLAAAVPPRVNVWSNRNGVLELDDLKGMLGESTKLVQVSLVSFLNGHRIEWAPFRNLVRAKAPNAILAVDVTQAFGRVDLDCLDADCIISSTHKWILALHGGCVVSIPKAKAHRLTPRAGGWYHLQDAFGENRFKRAKPNRGAAGFSVGMPNFASIYALRAGLEFIEGVGVAAIENHATPLVEFLHGELVGAGFQPMAPLQPGNMSGIVSFRHPKAEQIQTALLERNVHVMHQAGRMRVSVHGYNQPEDVERFLEVLRKFS